MEWAPSDGFAFFPFVELFSDMQQEVRLRFTPLDAFLFTFTSKTNHRLFGDLYWRSRFDLFSLAVSEGHFEQFEFLIPFFRTTPTKALSDPKVLLSAIRKGHVAFLQRFLVAFPELKKSFLDLFQATHRLDRGVFDSAGRSRSQKMVDFIFSLENDANCRESRSESRFDVAMGALKVGAIDFAAVYLQEVDTKGKELQLCTAALQDPNLGSLKYMTDKFDPDQRILKSLTENNISLLVKAGAYKGLKYLLALDPKTAGAYRGMIHNHLRSAVEASENRVETVSLLLETGCRSTWYDWNVAAQDPDMNILRLLAEHDVRVNSGDDPEFRALCAFVGRSLKALNDVFPTYRVRNLELFEKIKERGVSFEGLAWLISRSDFASMDFVLQRLRDLGSVDDKAIFATALCELGVLKVEDYIVEIIASRKLRLLLKWIRNGGTLALSQESLDSLFPRLIKDAATFPHPLAFLAEYGFVPSIRQLRRVLEDHKLLEDPNIIKVLTAYLQRGACKESPDLVELLSQWRSGQSLLELALTLGYPCSAMAKSRAMTLAHNPLVKARFQTDLLITPGAFKKYLMESLRTVESDRAVADLTPELKNECWMRHLSSGGEELSFFSSDFARFAGQVLAESNSVAVKLLQKGVRLFRDSDLIIANLFKPSLKDPEVLIVAIELGYSIPKRLFALIALDEWIPQALVPRFVAAIRKSGRTYEDFQSTSLS